LAEDLHDHNPPYVWNRDRRAHLRAELDAAFFHAYGLDRDEVEHVMESFPVVKKNDLAEFGEYRTKRLILESYDAMQEVTRSGVPFESAISPPAGQGPRHPAKEISA
jgi:hypothetical protein